MSADTIRVETVTTPVLVGPVLRINEPPLPETVAYIRRLYGPAVTIVVDPTAVDA